MSDANEKIAGMVATEATEERSVDTCQDYGHELPSIATAIDGAPFQPGQFVRVVQAIDADIYDVTSYVGRFGIVKHLDYECGCGQHYPDDPMIGVRFRDGGLCEFWKEELVLVVKP